MISNTLRVAPIRNRLLPTNLSFDYSHSLNIHTLMRTWSLRSQHRRVRFASSFVVSILRFFVAVHCMRALLSLVRVHQVATQLI
jgi:hypothetical protein